MWGTVVRRILQPEELARTSGAYRVHICSLASNHFPYKGTSKFGWALPSKRLHRSGADTRWDPYPRLKDLERPRQCRLGGECPRPDVRDSAKSSLQETSHRQTRNGQLRLGSAHHLPNRICWSCA